jgi:hypothetical protein
MLNSGNFFVAESSALKSIYENALRAMMDHALSVAPPSLAAKAIRIAGLKLETKFIERFEGISAGSASGTACDAKASEKLMSRFRMFLHERFFRSSATRPITSQVNRFGDGRAGLLYTVGTLLTQRLR